MAAFEPGNSTNFHEFRQYQNGEMSNREQHSFEKKLLSDLAFADAYDGFLKMQEAGLNADKISAELSGLLSDRLSEKKGRGLSLWTYAAAASVMIILGTIAFQVFQHTDKKQEQQQITVVPEARIAPEQAAPAMPESNAAIDQSPSKTTSKKSAPVFAFKPEKETAVAAHDREQSTEEILNADVAEERIAAAEPEPVPSAFPSKSQPLQAMRQQAPAPSSGRVVNSYAAAGSATTSAKKELSLDAKPQPIGGWEAYQAYIDKNPIPNTDSSAVSIEFTVQADSSLSDFKVDAAEHIRDRAIQIIRQGPSWKPVFRFGAPAAATIRVSLKGRSSK